MRSGRKYERSMRERERGEREREVERERVGGVWMEEHLAYIERRQLNLSLML